MTIVVVELASDLPAAGVSGGYARASLSLEVVRRQPHLSGCPDVYDNCTHCVLL
jgi:hypothetical protein